MSSSLWLYQRSNEKWQWQTCLIAILLRCSIHAYQEPDNCTYLKHMLPAVIPKHKFTMLSEQGQCMHVLCIRAQLQYTQNPGGGKFQWSVCTHQNFACRQNTHGCCSDNMVITHIMHNCDIWSVIYDLCAAFGEYKVCKALVCLLCTCIDWTWGSNSNIK